jgi:acetyl-CoA synthetase
MTEPSSNLAALLKETRVFEASESFKNAAVIQDKALYQDAKRDYRSFWEKLARTELKWIKPWTKDLEWNPPYAKWFLGGKINVSVNCIDRHLTKYRHKTAIQWEGEPGDTRTLTYGQLSQEVNKFANVLKSLGIVKGDRITFYMPLVPELAVGMLACARIGAIHNVVFGGFSAESLADRINDSKSKILVTANGGYRRGNVVPLKDIADQALKNTPSIEKVILFKRGDFPIEFQENRDLWWHELMSQASAICPAESMDSEDMLFLLYTSGTTGKPKGIIHTTAGYLLGAHVTTKWVFDLKPSDIFWCTADIGWITGHSYVVYGPLSNAATVLMYEGSPDWPDKDRFWSLVEKYHVNIFYTAPTAIRTFMKWGDEYIERHNLSSLRLLGTVGEPINPDVWVWYHKTIGQSKCPVVDTWWQTETGAIMISPLPAVIPQKPGSATLPLPGFEIQVLNEAGMPVPPGSGGYLAITKPWPSMLRGIYGDPERYQSNYWNKWEGIYFTGDGARIDEDGYLWLLGRVDDVINVSGHRIGTSEVESALVDHPSVAESAVVGRNHEIKGTAIAAFVTLRSGFEPSPGLIQELKDHVVTKIGALARPEEIIFSADLPKTRSGKIMRRLLRDIAEGKVLGDTTTLADPAVVADLKGKYEEEFGA